MAERQSPQKIDDWQNVNDWQDAPPEKKPPLAPAATIRAADGGIKGWLDDLVGDIRYGGGRTAPGRVLRAMGAQGTSRGSQASSGELMGGNLIGPVRAIRSQLGVLTGEKNPITGTLETAGAVAQSLGPFGLITTPESGAANVAASAPRKVSGMLSGASRVEAGKQALKYVASRANGAIVDVSGPGNAALEAAKLGDSGSQVPMVIRKFLDRVTKSEAPPMTYEEARRFFSNATRLSSVEYNRLNPPMKAAIVGFRNALAESLQATTEASGAGAEYSAGISKYASGMKQKRLMSEAGRTLSRKALEGAGMAGGGSLVYGGYKLLSKR